ncbi:hypothetical protein [Sphingobium yanoikuyae]|uniref:Uncharacterized protein n=1 Tax=Sphingobium yanoikuyae TaxID=13690 RepID=A0A0J9D656_SPHYA|nr:hypothetical protein [Sphingobium yanoikuyae]ATP19778.1 hypothetical protein BV87_16155 [Sphingobium yanoikuyae]KMW31971.1 hypothetical protein BV87_20985 [Sphingobium yanoikuyae]
MTGPQEAALAEAVRKARRDRIHADEQEQIVSLLQRLPITQVKEQTGRTYRTLLRIAEVAL